MSYKETIQANNTAIASANAELEELIDIANALPDAGGGEEIPICTFVCTSTGEARVADVYYSSVSESGELAHKSVRVYAATVTLSDVVCGSIVTVIFDYTTLTASLSGCEGVGSYTTRMSQSINIYGITAGNGGTATVETA